MMTEKYHSSWPTYIWIRTLCGDPPSFVVDCTRCNRRLGFVHKVGVAEEMARNHREEHDEDAAVRDALYRLQMEALAAQDERNERGEP